MIPPDDRTLHAYLDRRVTGNERDLIEHYLESEPGALRRLETLAGPLGIGPLSASGALPVPAPELAPIIARLKSDPPKH